MGTYTPNYGLYKPDIGEKGWGDKVNANFDTIDSVMHENRSQISRIKKDMLTIALNVMMNKALLNAETKDFYSIIADVITDEYPYGFKNTFETVPTGVKFDNDGGGNWTKAIKITLTTIPSEYAQYRIVIQSNTMQIYSADGTLKADYGAETGVASDFWNNVKSDGSDIRIADQNYSQLYFWIEEFDYSGKYAVIWVKIPANTTELYIAYGNPDALPSAYNDGEQVFEYYNDGTLDTLNTKYGTWTIKQENGNNVIQVTGDVSGYHEDAEAVGLSIKNFILMLKIRRVTAEDNWAGVKFRTGSGGAYLFLSYTNKTEGSKVFYTKNSEWSSQTGWTQIGTTGSFYFNDFEWHEIIVKVFEDNIKIYVDGNLEHDITDSNIIQEGSIALSKDGAVTVEFDDVKVAKLADPASFGDAEVITLVTTGDFITVTFDFPEGVDKLLITVDSDAQAIYYSTDDGQTWNAIEPDTETPLPETAYSVKWKFEFATYVRGYAFITW